MAKKIQSKGILIEALDDLTGWVKGEDPSSWTLGLDTTLEAITMEPGSGDDASITKDSVNYDLSTLENLALSLKFSDVTKSDGITIYLSNNPTLFTDYVKFNLNIENRFLSGGLYQYVLSKADSTEYGSFSWDSPIQRIRIKIIAQAGEDLTITLKDLKFNYSQRPKIMVMFDDGNSTVYSTAKPILDTNNIKTTQAIISSHVEDEDAGYMTEAQIQTLFNDEHDIVNHTDTHTDLTTLSEAEIVQEIGYCDNFLETKGWNRDYKLTAYPLGEYNDTVLSVTRDYTTFGRSTDSENNYKGQLQFKNNDDVKIWAMSVLSTDSTADIQSAIDACIERNGLFILLYHIIRTPADIASATTDANFTTIMEYIAGLRDAGTVDIVTWNEYMVSRQQPEGMNHSVNRITEESGGIQEALNIALGNEPHELSIRDAMAELLGITAGNKSTQDIINEYVGDGVIRSRADGLKKIISV